jgi:hypothetical protein
MAQGEVLRGVLHKIVALIYENMDNARGTQPGTATFWPDFGLHSRLAPAGILLA